MNKSASTLLFLLFFSISPAQSPIHYICPMYCTGLVSDKPGQCPECKMDLEDKAVVENPTTHKLIEPAKAWSHNGDTAYFFLDVRSPDEFSGKTGRVKGSVNIPIGDLTKRLGELESYKPRTILAYCSQGIRSARAARILQEKGFTVFSVIGGTTKWIRDGLPVATEPKRKE